MRTACRVLLAPCLAGRPAGFRPSARAARPRRTGPLRAAGDGTGRPAQPSPVLASGSRGCAAADFGALQAAQRTLVVEHERTHLRRGDLPANRATTLGSSLFDRWCSGAGRFLLPGLACDYRCAGLHPAHAAPMPTPVEGQLAAPGALRVPLALHHPLKESSHAQDPATLVCRALACLRDCAALGPTSILPGPAGCAGRGRARTRGHATQPTGRRVPRPRLRAPALARCPRAAVAPPAYAGACQRHRRNPPARALAGRAPPLLPRHLHLPRWRHRRLPHRLTPDWRLRTRPHTGAAAPPYRSAPTLPATPRRRCTPATSCSHASASGQAPPPHQARSISARPVSPSGPPEAHRSPARTAKAARIPSRGRCSSPAEQTRRPSRAAEAVRARSSPSPPSNPRDPAP